MQVATLEGSAATGRTTHIVGGHEVNEFASLVLAQYPGEPGICLFYCDHGWNAVTDRWHEKLDDAISQAEYEFGPLQFVPITRVGPGSPSSIGGRGRRSARLTFVDDNRQRVRVRGTGGCQDRPMLAFSDGQYVELYPTIPSRLGGSVDAGTRGIVREIDPARPGEDIYRIEFLSNDRLTGEQAWLREADLFTA